MLKFLVIVQLLLLTASGSQNCLGFCVASGNESKAECQQHNVTYRLSDLMLNETNCTTIHIYLTRGTHTLDRDLIFSDSVEEVKIHGRFHGQTTIIHCMNNTGIRFSENMIANKVLLINIVVLHCHTRTANTDQAALFFKHAQYNITNVVVKSTKGYGLYAENCNEQAIINCTFINNSRPHVQIILRGYITPTNVHIHICNSLFRDGGGIQALCSHNVICNFSIAYCEFHENERSHLQVTSESAITNMEIVRCTFTNSFQAANIYCRELACSLVVIIKNSTFINHKFESVLIGDAQEAKITECIFDSNNVGVSIDRAIQLTIRDSTVQNNRVIGIFIDSRGMFQTSTQEITTTTFLNNSRGLILRLPTADIKLIIYINECFFLHHKLIQASTDEAAVTIERSQSGDYSNDIVLEKSLFKGNQGFHGECSALLIKHMNNLTLSNLNITDNGCTGITLSASSILLKNTMNLIRNHGKDGGALSVKSAQKSNTYIYLLYNIFFSQITFTNSSKLNVINNTADTYGGGIFTDTTCTNRKYKGSCFFQFTPDYTLPRKIFTFSGNNAKRGGDSVFGGCLSNCSVVLNEVRTTINKSDTNNIFWSLVSLKKKVSQSTFVEYPNRVAFCMNTTEYHSPTCTSSHTINAYRGEKFTVLLTVVNDFCFPSVDLIKAKVNETNVNLENDVFQESKKYCYNFTYIVTGGTNLTRTVIELDIRDQYSSTMHPATLTVQLSDCPAGYKINHEGVCMCRNILKSYRITCNLKNFSLNIPAQTWVGELMVGSGKIAVQRECRYCKHRGIQVVKNVTRDSAKLCIANRHRVMCGACVAYYSLQLGGYECADCSNFTYKGVLLLIAFMVVGIVLVLLLLGLNLTVSTGMINGLIFDSNIVYLNSDTLLPITREGNSTHLQNTVRILSTFQAWMNLDFGIVTCFFDGYDTYISTCSKLSFLSTSGY